jgi:hypothetical protein
MNLGEMNFKELKEELQSNDKDIILGKYVQGKKPEDIAKEVKKTVEVVSDFIKDYEKMNATSTEVISVNIKENQIKLQKEIDVVDNLHFVVDKLKWIVSTLEVDDPNTGEKKVSVFGMKSYLDALKNFSNITQWMADRKIKIEEIIQNDIFKQAVLEELKAESPEFRERVLSRIEKLRRQNNLIS